MFTLTAQDLHGVIILEDEQTEESVIADIAEETGLLDPNGCGKTLRVGGGRKHNQETQLPTRYHQSGGGSSQPQIMNVANTNPSGHGMNGSVYFAEGLAPTLTTNKGEGIKVITIEK